MNPEVERPVGVDTGEGGLVPESCLSLRFRRGAILASMVLHVAADPAAIVTL